VTSPKKTVFFGAEPPKLVAEMLTILAKRSNQIGIAARTEGTNVLLTPAQRSQDPAPVASAPEAQRIETPIVDHPPVASAEPSLTLEERLQKIRSVVNAKSAANVALQHAIADAPDAEPMDQEVTDTFDENLDNAPIDDTLDETSRADEIVPIVEDASDVDMAHDPDMVANDDATDIPVIEAEAIEDEAIKDVDVETETASTDEPDIDLGADTFVLRNDVDDESARDMGSDALNDDNDLSITKAPVAEDDSIPNTPKPQRQGRVHVIDLRSNNPLPEPDDMSFEDELSKALSFDDTPAEPDIKPTQDHIDDTTFDDMFEEDLEHSDDAQDDNAPVAIDEHDDHRDDTVAVSHDFDDMPNAPIMPTRPQITKSTTSRRDANMDEPQMTVTRLMDKTDQKLAHPDNSRRRNALAHLRAAVAATMADKSLVKSKNSDAADVYRNDLAKAVRPPRPTRSDEPRVAPLRLVAEQRIDVSAEQERPTSPAAAPAPAAQSHGKIPNFQSFDEFVDYMGANTLAAKLEAAATYLAQVQGIETFTRPQIMRTVMASEGENFPREESLMNFARMIRDGKIARSGNGMFEITDDIGYRLEDRKTG
jgi:hypothetical protein